jgi:hypothetical protein
MRTDDLIAALAREAGPAPRAVAARRLASAIVLGLLASACGAVVFIGLVPQVLFAQPGWWLKLGYALVLAATCAPLVARLARPGVRTEAAWGAVLAVPAAVLALGAAQLMGGAPAERPRLLFGHSWTHCPWNVLALSLPALAGVLWALRGLAPTQLRAAGFGAGLLAGAVGAAGYALSCEELSMAFVAVWYSLGIGMTGALGAALGPRLLRW